MAKFIVDAAMDAELAYIRDTTTTAAVCSDQPADFAGIAAVALGTLAWGTALWTLDDGDTSGRKITASAGTFTIGTSGTVDHIAYYSADTLIAVGTIAPTAVTASGTLIANAFDLNEIRDIA